jgi:2-polyprenyl-3-methyl-5-hydroxy-6-metoxy-1,4-benzoquinol methylase
LGCGNSIISEELYDRGFKCVYNNDISSEVILQMAERNADKRPELKWDVMDVREMTYDSNFFDIIIDKSTIDALLCGDEAFINTAKMLKEC